MTTIAYRDGVLAVDSRATMENGGAGRKRAVRKLVRKSITEGRKTFDILLAAAGDFTPGRVFIDWYGSGKPPPEALTHHGGDFVCLVLRPDGLYEYDIYLRGERIEEDFYAVGSGADAALAAMHCGKSAVEAVRIAARVDAYTGGKIVSEALAPTPGRRSPGPSRRSRCS